MKKIKAISLLTAAMLLTGCSETAGETVPSDMSDGFTELTEPTEPDKPLRFTAAEDYYGYINLDRLDSLEIGYGRSSAGSFDEAEKYVDDCLKDIISDLREGGKNYPVGSNEQLVRGYYEQILDFDVTPDSRTDFFDGWLGKINGAKTMKELVDVSADLYRETGTLSVLCLSAEPDPSSGRYTLRFAADGMPVFGCLMKELASDGYEGASLSKRMTGLMKELGVEESEAEERAKKVVYLLMDISRRTDWEAMEEFDYDASFKPCTMSDLQGVFTNIDISAFLEKCSGRQLGNFSFADRESLASINDAFAEENLQPMKDILTAAFLGDYGELLTDKYRVLRAKYFAMSKQFRENIAFGMVKQDMDYEIGELYADRYGDEQAAETARALCEDMRDSYRELIKGADWLSDEARALCIDKLDKMDFVIGRGHPDPRIMPSTGLIGETLLDTRVNLNHADTAKMLESIGKPFDPYIMAMAPHYVNACYDTCNMVYIPYGILVKPFFDPNASEAENLGAIGSVIAHEMSHAFDSNCIAFDANGVYDPERIPKADRDAFEKKMDEVKEYYSRFRVVNVYSVNGEQTLGENFADLGGMECIISAVDTMAEKKTVLEAYAGIWCSLEITRDAIQQLCYDTHSPASVRVNAVVSSCDAFYDIYDIKEGDAMYISPEERVSRW